MAAIVTLVIILPTVAKAICRLACVLCNIFASAYIDCGNFNSLVTHCKGGFGIGAVNNADIAAYNYPVREFFAGNGVSNDFYCAILRSLSDFNILKFCSTIINNNVEKCVGIESEVCCNSSACSDLNGVTGLFFNAVYTPGLELILVSRNEFTLRKNVVTVLNGYGIHRAACIGVNLEVYVVCLESIRCFKIDVLIGHIELDSLIRGLVAAYEGEALCSCPTCKVVAGSRLVCHDGNDRAYNVCAATCTVCNVKSFCLNRNDAGITVAVCFCVGADDGKCLACPLGKKLKIRAGCCEGIILYAGSRDLVGCAGAEVSEIVVFSIKSDFGSRFLNVNCKCLFKTGVNCSNADYVNTCGCTCGNGKGDNTVNCLACCNGKAVGLANAKIGVGSIGRSNGCNNSTCAVLIKNKTVLVKCKTCYRLVGSYRVIVNNKGCKTVIRCVRHCTLSICNLNGNRACRAGCCGSTADVAVICGKS